MYLAKWFINIQSIAVPEAVGCSPGILQQSTIVQDISLDQLFSDLLVNILTILDGFFASAQSILEAPLSRSGGWLVGTSFTYILPSLNMFIQPCLTSYYASKSPKCNPIDE